MAPTSHLLVYYTTEKGETINDVISFNVKQTDPKVSNRYECEKLCVKHDNLKLRIQIGENKFREQ